MIRDVTHGENWTMYLGDCREILPTLTGIDAVVTDPPYGMSFRSNRRMSRHRAIAGDGDHDLLSWACELDVRHSKYIFGRWDNIGDIPKPRSVVTWVKNIWSMGDLAHEHARQTELIFFFPGVDHRFPDGRPSDVVFGARTGNDHHPTEKPVDLLKLVVGWTSGTVLDPFAGSGSTGVACIETGRRFIGIEVDGDYYRVACNRLRSATPCLFGNTMTPARAKEDR